jgi:hypothetical protein
MICRMGGAMAEMLNSVKENTVLAKQCDEKLSFKTSATLPDYCEYLMALLRFLAVE